MKKIQRKIFFKRFPDFVKHNARKNEYTYPLIYKGYKLTVDSKSAKGHARLLAAETAKLFSGMGYTELYFLGDNNIPWLYRTDHDYKHVTEAFEFLKANTVSKTFTGGLEVDMKQLPVFIKHLYWLVRCNGVIPYINFTDSDSNIMGSICKYGALHLNILNQQADLVFNAALSKTKFIQLGNDDCKDPFSKWSRIPNRRAVLM